MKYTKIMWDGKTLEVPSDMGCARADQLQGSSLDNLTELAGRVCYDKETQVLTQNGWVFFSHLEKDVSVATYNRRTGEMEFQVPTDYIEKHHTGEMYEIDNTKVSLRVTDDHELWCLPASNSEWQLIRAQDMCGKRYYVKRHAAYLGEQCESIQLPKYEYTQELSNQFGNYGTRTSTVNGLLIKADKMLAWARFLGYYFAEGCVSKKTKAGRCIVIYQNRENVEPILKTVRELGFKHATWLDKRNDVLRVMVYSGPIARYLEQFGKTACEKRLPRECLNWHQQLRAELLDALMFGDGHTTKNSARVYNSCSELLADDVQELIIKSGRVGTISYSPVAKMYRVRESLHDLHMVNKHKQQDQLTETDETVYCVQVPNRILVIRRNKKVVLCANCYDSLGNGRNSADYHQHIADVGHGSVQEHVNLTFAMPVDIPAYLTCCEALLNRPGVWVSKTVPIVSIPGEAMYLRITANLRAIREWHEFQPMNKMSKILGDAIQNLAKKHAPLVMQDIPTVNDPACPMRVVEPAFEDELWVTVFFTNVSRGFSHELVRHKYRTAVSQRSTRYVDENEAPWAWHPLILKHAETNPHNLSLLQQCEVVCKDAYSSTVTTLQKFMIDQGADKFTARKQARGAARGVLGNALLTELVFSASIAEWKWIFKLRANSAADAEIRVVMNEAYELLSERFPQHFDGWSKSECPDKIGYALSDITPVDFVGQPK